MKKLGIFGLVAGMSVGFFVGNLSLAGCMVENEITYCDDVTIYTDTEGRQFPMGTITIASGDESVTILDRNLGASMTGYGAQEEAYGYRFQWGNNYGFPTTGELNISMDIADASNYSWSNPYVDDTFVRVKDSKISWDSGNNINLWGGISSYSYQRQGPCPEGYHVPTAQEQENWWNLYKKVYPAGGFSDFLTKFFVTLPGSWYPYISSDLRLNNPGVDGYYWSSTKGNTSYRIRHMYVTEKSESMVDSNRSYALPVRCFANPTYVVVFETNGGSSVKSLTGLEGTKLNVPETPTHIGYSFSGWYLSGSDTEWNFNTDIISGDITLYAKWNKLELDDGLILYYNFDGDSVNGNEVSDLSEKNNTGTANGGVIFNIYNGEGSAEFNGTGNIVFGDYGEDIKEVREGSLSLRLKPFGTGDQIIIGSSYGPALGFYKNKLIGFSAPSGGKSQADLNNLNIGEWNNIIVILSGHNVNYYINGGEVAKSGSQYWTWNSFIGKIGSRDTGDKPFSGYLDEIRVYDRVLSNDEILELYNKGFRPGKVECNVIYSQNEGGIDAVLDCPKDVVVTSAGEKHTFTESGSYLFEYDYGWGTGSIEASVNMYTVEFNTLSNYGALSGTTNYSVLAWNGGDFESLGIVIPELIPSNEYYVGSWVGTVPTVNTIVNDNLVFIAEFNPIHDDNNNGIADEEESKIIPEPKVSGGRSGGVGHRIVSDNLTDGGLDFDGEVEITYEDEYSLEMNEAYQFAFENGITTKENISDADMDGALTRMAMAKMLSQYAINVLGKAPANLIVPKFVDVTEGMNEQYNDGVSLAYQLGIMGINMPDNKFRPNDLVTRAEFGTALSRMLYGITDGEDVYYSTHLDRLYDEGIITNKNSNLQELRGYVMLMLMRSKNSLY